MAACNKQGLSLLGLTVFNLPRSPEALVPILLKPDTCCR
jgi:hypothetical protein